MYRFWSFFEANGYPFYYNPALSGYSIFPPCSDFKLPSSFPCSFRPCNILPNATRSIYIMLLKTFLPNTTGSLDIYSAYQVTTGKSFIKYFVFACHGSVSSPWKFLCYLLASLKANVNHSKCSIIQHFHSSYQLIHCSGTVTEKNKNKKQPAPPPKFSGIQQ